MTTKKHKDYESEVERLEYTKEYIEKTIAATDTYRDIYKSNIKNAMAELDYLDSSQSYIEIILNTKFMEVAERNYDNLRKVRKKPYFARIDFKRKGGEETEKLYIGKVSLIKAEDEMPLIVDWRSPVADIYYEGRLGEVSYETETQTEEGELLLKRQFMIEDGEIEDILDIDITANDAFLQASLEANVDNKLKDIASTIQAEQNRVIRAPMEKALIVQGSAGSGKTTIALHRIAYFMYKYEKTFDPDTFMIMAPNKLFINYISEVLPELGVENIRQTTFIDFMQELVGKKYKLVEENQLLLEIIENKTEDIDIKKWYSAFKGSLEFKNIVSNYIDEVESRYTPRVDFKLGDYVLEKYEVLRKAITEDFTMFPLYKRSEKLKDNLRTKLKQRKKEILKEVKESYDSKIDKLRARPEYSEDIRLEIVSLIDERDYMLEELSKKSKTAVNSYIKTFEKHEAIDYYVDLVTDPAQLLKYSDGKLTPEKAEYLSENSNRLLSKKQIHLEDYPPLAYITHRIHGFKSELNIKSIVIDEAQDLSLFQFYVLKNILNTERFTILGDISQGIHSYRAIQDWEQVESKIFGKDKVSYKQLVQSYRTTVEIMDCANSVISKLENEKITLAKPVIRHGKPPALLDFQEEHQLVETLALDIKALAEKYESIALICKTTEESKYLKKLLAKLKLEVHIIDEKQEVFEAGVSIVPAHLSKGLEFDAVLVTSLLEDYRETDTDLKLLYVAMTRALHELHIYRVNGNMSMLEGVI